jgi:ectoine hydroxylase-related dioxygenase (phytanoyl-CoA dioxygenase family)
MVFLDDANRKNGCLEVLPGSHKRGVWPRKQVDGFGAMEMELEGFDESQLVPVECPAGSAIYIGSLLVHRSLPNLSDHDRRLLLFSYQPAGRRHSLDGFKQLAGR